MKIDPVGLLEAVTVALICFGALFLMLVFLTSLVEPFSAYLVAGFGIGFFFIGFGTVLRYVFIEKKYGHLP